MRVDAMKDAEGVCHWLYNKEFNRRNKEEQFLRVDRGLKRGGRGGQSGGGIAVDKDRSQIGVGQARIPVRTPKLFEDQELVEK